MVINCQIKIITLNILGCSAWWRSRLGTGPEQQCTLGQHVDIAYNSKLMLKTKENLGHRLKISSIDYNKSSLSIPLQILPHFDVRHIFVAQKLAKWHHFKEFNKKFVNWKSLKIK